MQTRLSGRYELLDKLGEGGVAVVYRAQDTVLGRMVAIKILREQFAADPAFLERFHREAQAAARLSHPNIISVYDVGQDEGRHYIVMEYVEGQDLKALIQSKSPLPVGQALAIAEQVCAALDHAHQQGFVHRDIKPHNILIVASRRQAAGPKLQVKVADFGLAGSLSSVTASQGELVFGTVQYISPEQARGGAATPASDVYSTGVVLYEMLTGRLPFESDTVVGLALKHIQEEPAPPSRLNTALPPSVNSLVLRALDKQPEKRYDSAAAMAAALAGYRQFSEEATGRFQPVRPTARPPSTTKATPARPVAVSPARPLPQKKGGFDWLLFVLFVITFIALAGLVPLAFAVQEAVFPPSPTPVPQVQVPDLTGLEQAVAEAQLQALGLALVVQDGRYDEKVPPQRIIAQLVPPGTMVSPGETVEVIVSRGREKIKVPPLVGLPLNEAQMKLGTLGLQSASLDKPSTQVKAGVIMAQEPPPETEVERGSVVRLTVSVGDRVVVPNLFGRPEAEAQRLLREAGLATTYPNPQAAEDVPVESRWVFSVVAVGSVISQTPEAGALVERGTVVKIAIRKQ